MKNIVRQKTKNKCHFVIPTQANDGVSQGYAHYVSCCKATWTNTDAGTKQLPTN